MNKPSAQSSAQQHYNAEDTAILYYIEAHRKTGKSKRKTESHRKPIEKDVNRKDFWLYDHNFVSK